ncbi:adenine deaminase, partial [bacterium]|nr:adenine deaminase [bacterium]
MKRLEGLAAARGEKKADLLLKNGRIVDVFSGEIFKGDIAVWGGRVIGFGAYEAREVLDLENRIAAPGFIDAHVHIESAMVGIPGYAAAVLPRGTTSVVIDPHEIANVLGNDG